MSKKFVITLTLLIIVCIITSIFFYFPKNKSAELYLGEWDGVLNTSEDNIIINLIGISKQSLSDLQKDILAIKFRDSEELEINGFNITTSNDDYQGKKYTQLK
ncbi:MAG: hypothetical protein ACI4XL_12915 [Bacillus sp. (in: firmicutes)]